MNPDYDPQFLKKLELLPSLLQQLMMSPAMSPLALPASVSGPGVYLFSEHGADLYVGRTRDLRRRIRQHANPSSRHRVAALAFRLAREATGHLNATYGTEGSRDALSANQEFAAAFDKEKVRIASMTVRAIEIRDDLTQCLFEIYAATVLATRHNAFRTH